MPSKEFEFKADRMDQGLDMNSARNIPLGGIAEGFSVRYEPKSGIKTGTGYKEVSDLGTSATVDGLYGAKIYPILWGKSGTKIYYIPNIDTGTEYDTGLTATADTYTSFHEQGNGDIFVMNKSDTNTRIAIAKNTVVILDSDSTITVGADFIDKYAASGIVRVNGDAISYTGVNSTQLTGCTGIQAGGHPVNSYVIQTSNPATWTEEKGTFAFELESRMVIGGQVNKENVLSASAPEDLSNPQFYYDFDGNGAVKRIFPQPLTGGIKGANQAFIFMKNEVHKLSGFDVTTGAFLVAPISQRYGAYNPRCVVDMDGIIAFFGNNRLMPITLQLTPDAQTSPYLNEEFDNPIRPWLRALDPPESQDDAHLHYDSITKILKIAARKNGKLETYVFDLQTGKFAPEESRPGFVFANFGTYSYFGDTVGKIYKDDFGLTNNGLAIEHYWKTGRMEYDKGRKDFQCKWFECEGFMSRGMEYELSFYFDGESEPSVTFSLDDSSITSETGVSIGERSIGINTIGSGDEVENLVYPYKAHVILRGYGGEDVAIGWRTSKEGGFLQVNSFSLSAYLTKRSQTPYQ